MTQTSKPRNARNQRTSTIIHGGVSRRVVVKVCPVCGKDLKGIECQNILTRFKCPECNVSIENTNENRCKTCYTMCSDSETYNAHKWGGCSYAGTNYPLGVEMRNDPL